MLAIIEQAANPSAGLRTVLLAHQGGWDEILLVAGPILAIVGLLALAKRRVDGAARHDASDRDVNDQELGS